MFICTHVLPTDALRLIPARTPEELRVHYSILPDGDTPVKLANNENAGARYLYNQVLQNELLETDYSTPLDWSPARPQSAQNNAETAPAGSARLSPTGVISPPRLLNYRSNPPPPAPFSTANPLSPATNALLAASARTEPMRKIAKMPYKVLEAPLIQDDFYLSLLDWSSQDVLAVGLGATVYLWQPRTQSVTKLCDVPAPSTVTSLSWMARGTHLAVGSSSGEVSLWDTVSLKRLRTFRGHRARVGCLAWAPNDSTPWRLSTGSRDHTVLQRDVRIAQEWTGKLNSHKQEVCGLKWGVNPASQLATGGNDNRLLIWDARNESRPIHSFTQHRAAVKALSWSPHERALLASGGGTADQCLRFWHTGTGSLLQTVDTGSQVCNVHWSRSCDELVSTHGYSLNQIVVWHWPSMRQLAQLTGHTMRVLYLAVSPDETSIVTGAGDETLRFWAIFPALSRGSASGGSKAGLQLTQGVGSTIR